jgi:hypothetical protein
MCGLFSGAREQAAPHQEAQGGTNWQGSNVRQEGVQGMKAHLGKGSQEYKCLLSAGLSVMTGVRKRAARPELGGGGMHVTTPCKEFVDLCSIL